MVTDELRAETSRIARLNAFVASTGYIDAGQPLNARFASACSYLTDFLTTTLPLASTVLPNIGLKDNRKNGNAAKPLT